MIYIPVEKNFLPEEFEIELGEERFIMIFNYNETYDFFTVDLYTEDRESVVAGEKLVIGQTLWWDIVDSRLPAPSLVPVDQSENQERITFENFMVTTFLMVDQEADADDNS